MADSIRESFEQAFEQAEEEAKNAAPETVEPLPDPAPANDGVREEETPATPAVEHEATPPEPTPASEGAKATDTPERAPASWSPATREIWGKLPAEARAQVLKREKEVNEVIIQNAPARQAFNELNQVLAPHRERMMASGIENPIQMLGTMLDAERRLSSGDSQTRAATIANLIKGYNVDIQVLDGLLAGQQTAPGPHADIERLIEQRLAPVNQLLQQQQYAARQQEISQQHAVTEAVNSFSAQAEFIQDVRLGMADLLDLAAARGQPMTLEDAYKKACIIHPEVSKVLADRERQAQIMGTQTALQNKKNAAVSITGVQRGGTVANATALRDQIAAAWDDQLS